MAPSRMKRLKIEQNVAEMLPENKLALDRNLEEEEGAESICADDQEDVEGRRRNENGKQQRSKPKSIRITADQELVDMFEYKSNIFRMETDQLLSEVSIDYERRMTPVEGALHRLKDIIESIPERAPLSVADAEKLMSRDHEIIIPFPNPRPDGDVKYKLAYKKPSYINVIGSFALKTMVKQNSTISVDLMLTMPSEIFQEKDYLNYRYFYKRAYYLASIAAGIQSAKRFNGKLTFSLLNGDPLRSVLVVAPSGDGGEFDFSKSKCNIRIIPAILPGTFSHKKLAPSRNCVRPHPQEENVDLPPTPIYNASLLADTAYLSHLKLLHCSASQCTAFREAAILGRVWLRQRGFTGDFADGGFGNFEWSILMALLLKGGGAGAQNILASGFSNYQLFKATLQWIAARDLVKNPFAANGSDATVPVYGPGLPVIFDGVHEMNLLFQMSPWSYRLLRQEANLTIKTLNGSAVEQFYGIFLERVEDPILRYDLIARVSLPGECTASIGDNVCTDKRAAFARKLYSSLIHGLTDRVTLLHLKLPTIGPWSIKKQGGDSTTSNPLVIGFLLDGDKCNRIMDHGPPAEDKKAASAFRKFWGEKAELRRFKDGSILESLYWGDNGNKAPIFERIVTYIINKHLGTHIAETISFTGDEYAESLSKHQIPGTQATTKLFQPVMNGYDALVKDLRAIEGLPLHIRHISPTSPALRYCTIKCPLSSTGIGELMEPADIVLQFETSSRWPDDLVAIQKTKVALLLKIVELLDRSSNGQTSTRVGIENEDNPILNNSFLDIVYRNGPAFRVRIHHEREVLLLERRMTNKNISPYQREEASHALSLHRRLFIKAPLHTQSMQKLCHRYPLLSPTVRLVKKWFTSHLLKFHFTDELIELLVARSFVSSFPWTPPSSVSTGFLRTLEFLSTWDWRRDPLIVDTSEEEAMSSTDLEDIQSRFETLRKSDPALNRTVLFAASSHDHEGITWAETGPSRVVASRMTILAKATIDFVKSHDIASSININVKSLFITPLTDYSFIIHLSRSLLLASSSNSKKKPSSSEQEYKNIQITAQNPLTTKNLEKISFHPVQLFVSELRQIFGNTIVFFHGGEEAGSVGNLIGGLWCPSATQERAWKVNLSYNTVPNGDAEDVSVTVNKAAIINEITRLGGDMIEWVEVNETLKPKN